MGLIEGAAEATALIVKVFSGVLSDYWGRRKPLAVFGYGLGALSKPLFALAAGVGMRFLSELERGKPTVRLAETLRVAAALGVDLVLEDSRD